MAGRGAASAAEAGHHRRAGVSVAALQRTLRQTETLAAGGGSGAGGGTADAATRTGHGSAAGTRGSRPHPGENIKAERFNTSARTLYHTHHIIFLKFSF